MYPPSSLAGMATYRFVIYQDRPLLPLFFGSKHIRPVFFRNFTGPANHLDVTSLNNVLIEQTRFDWVRGKESDLAAFSMDVWVPEVYDCAHSGYCDHRPACQAIYPGWRYIPQNHRATDGSTFAA